MKTHTLHEREKHEVVLGVLSILIVLGVSSSVIAAANWDIYGDAIIGEGDQYDDINIFDNAIVTMTGGEVDSIVTHDASNLIVHEGYIRKADGWGSSAIEVYGGIFNSIEASWNSVVNFSGSAETSCVVVEGSGSFNMEDGIVTFIGLWGSGMTNIRGGVISDYILASDDSTANIYGYDLSLSTTGGVYGYGEVSGFWEDNTYFNIDLKSSDVSVTLFL